MPNFMLFEATEQPQVPVQLRWAPRTVSFTQVINLNSDTTSTVFSVSNLADVSIVPRTVVENRTNLTFRGGRTWTLKGGLFRPGTSGGNATLEFANVRDYVFLEGLHIDNTNVTERDGIRITSLWPYNPNIWIQRCLLENIKGSAANPRAGINLGFTPTGRLGHVHMDRVTIYSNYWGIWADPQAAAGLRSLSMNGVNVRRQSIAAVPAFVFYTGVANFDRRACSVSLNQVWVQPDSGEVVERHEVLPNDQASGTAAYQGGTTGASAFNATRSIDPVTGNAACHWPSLQLANRKLVGYVNEGIPSAGDFVASGQVGLGYVSPGYVTPPAALPITPIGTGFATTISGGFGQSVYKVTNLNNSGAGSFRDAVSSGNRFIVFEVSGACSLASGIQINSSNITIAGETAPGLGFNLHHGGGNTPLTIAGQNIIIRHLRIRRGLTGVADGTGDQVDGLSLLGLSDGTRTVKDVWIDHCSIAWSVDELTQMWYPPQYDVSFTNCLFHEPLNYTYPVHTLNQNHGMGLIVGHDMERVDIQKSVFANCYRRCPRTTNGAKVAMLNSIIFNWWSTGVEIGQDQPTGGTDPSFFTGIGNLGIFGPDNNNGAQDQPHMMVIHRFGSSLLQPGSHIFWHDNWGWNGATPEARWENYTTTASLSITSFKYTPWTGSWTIPDGTPYNGLFIPGWAAMDHRKTYQELLLNVGARPKTRDSVELRTISQLQNWSIRGVINNPSSVGGHPTIPTLTRTLSVPTSEADQRSWLEQFVTQVAWENG